MAVQEQASTHFPTFSRAAATVRADVSGYYALVWSVAVVAFAVLHTALTFGASYWRYQGDVAAHDATVAAVDDFNRIAASTGSDWTWQQIGSPTLDLDTGAATGQVLAGTTSFGVLLAVALVLLAHGRVVSAYVAAATTGASVALFAGVLARTSPMIPVPSGSDPAWLNLDQYPVALRDARVALDRAMAAQDTATWWNYAIAALVAALAVGTVHVARRRGLTYVATPAEPLLVDLLVVGLVLGTSALLLGLVPEEVGWSERSLRLLLVTVVVAVLSARAAASSRIGTAVALSAGFGIAHALLYAAFDREGGAPGGWGVGTGGPQVYASMTTAAILVVAPVIGWIAGALWADRRQRREAAAATAAH